MSRFSFLGETATDPGIAGATDRRSGTAIAHGVLRDTLEAAQKLVQGSGTIFVPSLMQAGLHCNHQRILKLYQKPQAACQAFTMKFPSCNII